MALEPGSVTLIVAEIITEVVAAEAAAAGSITSASESREQRRPVNFLLYVPSKTSVRGVVLLNLKMELPIGKHSC